MSINPTDSNYLGLYPSLYPNLSTDLDTTPDTSAAPITASDSTVSEEQKPVTDTDSSLYGGYPISILKPFYPNSESNSAQLLEQYLHREMPTIRNLALAVNRPLEETLKFYEESLIPQELQTFQNHFSDEAYSLYFATTLREMLTSTSILKLAADYKEQFQKGVLNIQDMEKAYDQLAIFNPSEEINPKFELLIQTFDLSRDDITRDDIIGSFLNAKEEVAKTIDSMMQPQKTSWKEMFSKHKKPDSTEIEALKRKQAHLEKVSDFFLPKASDVPSDLLLPKIPDVNPELSIEEREDFVMIDDTPDEPASAVAAPAVMTPTAPSEIKATVVTPLVINAFHEERVRLQIASYLDIAYRELFNKTTNSEEIWSSIPGHSKRDIARHVIILPHINGKAEELARQIFKENEREMYEELNESNRLCPSAQLDPEFGAKGEELIEFFYSIESNGKFDVVHQKLKDLPIAKAPNFLKHVYEIATASDIKIEEWDYQWAENHWQEEQYFYISLQALEYCLHKEIPSQA